MAVSFSGSINISGSLATTGTITMSGSIASASFASTSVTSSYSTTASFSANATTASFATSANTASYAVNALTASYVTGQSPTSSYSLTASYVDSSVTDTTQNSRLVAIEAKTGSFATTGSNTFIGTQIFTGSVYITSDLVVQGSSSLQNITASAVSVGTNTVILNTDSPILRFGGISVQDSGSSQGRSGSLFWDSVHDHWIYVVPSGSSEGYNSAMLMNGPKNTGSLGSEVGLTTNYIPVSQGEDHIADSIIFQSGSTNIGIGTTVPSAKLDVAGTGKFSSDINVNNLTIGKGAYAEQYSTAIGKSVLASNINGIYNTGVGFEALKTINTGGGNTAVGMSALQAGTSASNNTALGHDTLYNNITGNLNTAVGKAALNSMTSGLRNTAIGWNAGSEMTNSNDNVIIGGYVGVSSMYNNIILSDGSGNIRYQWNGTNHIFSEGRVGIGTTNPNSKLQVGDGAQSGINGAGNKIHIASATSGGRSALLTLANSSGGTTVEGQFESSAESSDLRVIIGSTSNHPIQFRTNNSDVMRITNGGLVGIGTTNPASNAKVNIVGQGSDYGVQIDYSMINTGGSDVLFLRNTLSGYYTSIGLSANDSDGQHHRAVLKAKKDPVNSGNAAGIFQIDVRNTGASYTTVLTANALGNIGIGTTSPQDKLDVNGSIRFRANTPNFTAVPDSAVLDYVPTSIFSTDPCIRIAAIGTSGTAAEIRFQTGTSTSGPVERMRITGTGIVQPGANGTQDLGTSSLRWGTIYTSDLSLSNGIGDYTIVEGENDLFLYNNKQNKVYKFVLAEVDPADATPKKS
jgi:hypothetical protein